MVEPLNRAEDLEPASHPLGRALDLLGDQWTLLILQSAFLRIRRYSDIRVRLGVADAVLAARLRALLEADVLRKVPYRDAHRTRYEYRLTEAGMALWVLLISIWLWEREWVTSRGGDLPDLVHVGCGVIRPELACASCRLTTSAHDTTFSRVGDRLAAATQARRFRRQGWERVSDQPLLFFPDTMEILGDRWTTGILAAAFLGVKRFADFERELGVVPSVLSERLRRLVQVGVLTTAANSRLAGGADYRLTDKGLAFFPVFAFIVDWAKRHFGGKPGLHVLHHGHEFLPTLKCDRCGRLLARRDVQFRL